MILQTLDIRNNCFGAFIDDNFIIEPSYEDISACDLAWKHSPILDDDERFTYLYLLNRGEDLREYSSDLQEYLLCEKKIKAHQKAASTAKVDMSDSCFFDVVPPHQLRAYFTSRYRALLKLSENLNIPPDYNILHKIHVVSEKIRKQEIIFKGRPQTISYNIFGTATGRLTTKKSSMPILTIKKEERVHLTPSNDLFVELDYNAAEVRMLLALSGTTQPDEDIHQHLELEIFKRSSNRDKFKERLFAWLYNPNSQDEVFTRHLNKEVYLDFYNTENSMLKTPFFREIKVEDRKALNYLLQSSTSDQVLENAYKIQKFLSGLKSRISFILHDSIVLDMDKSDAQVLSHIKDIFEKTQWGRFKSRCKIGKNFGNLKEITV